jgi:hypothetical protein
MRHSRDTIIKISLIYAILPLLLFFHGCSYSAKSDTNSSTAASSDGDSGSSGTLEILSAHYWDRADNDVDNDTMYIAFNKAVSPSSFVSPHLIYNITGPGSIGTGSGYDYHFRSNFSVQRVHLDASSQTVSIGTTTISINPSTLEDSSGYGPDENNPAKTFDLLDIYAHTETGDDTCVKYAEENAELNVTVVDCNITDVDQTEGFLDENLSYYNDQNFSSQVLNGNNVVKDNHTGLIWEDRNSSLYTYSAAVTYCNNLVYAGYQDWRIPNMIELQSIIDRDRSLPAIITAFTTSINMDNSYWSNDTYVSDTNKQWGIDFYRGMTANTSSSFQTYVKCVRRDR